MQLDIEEHKFKVSLGDLGGQLKGCVEYIHTLSFGE